MPASSGNRRGIACAIALIIAVYLALACGTAVTKRPWCDEACFGNPGVDLMTRGTLGFTVREPTGDGIQVGWVFPRVQTHIYFVMPLDPVLQAGWFKLFGVHVFTMRSLHIVLGLAAMLCWGFLVWRLSGVPGAALLAMALIAVDRSVLLSAADGRPDMTSAAFGVAALAAYVALRERHLTAAVMAANALLTAAVLSHPIGGVAVFGLIYLAFHLDRPRLAPRHVAAAAAPYLVGLGLWGWYISLDPQAFWAQFTANASTGRFSALSAPFAGFWREVTVRYMERSYWPPDAVGWRKLSALIPVLYALAAILCSFAAGMRKLDGARWFGRLALLYFVAFSILEGTKPDFYLVHTTCVLCCCTALAVYSWWTRGAIRRSLAVAIAAGIIFYHAGWRIYSISRNPYRESYTRVTSFIKQHAGPHAVVMGGGELGFDLGFYGPVVDDATLGYFSGKRPDFVVVDDKCYLEMLEGLQGRAPAVYRHVSKLLREDLEKVFTAGRCDVYARRGSIPPP
jgi:hypothetical protein